MANSSLLVQHVGNALGKSENAQSAVLPRHNPLLIREKRESRPELGPESLVRLGLVDADRQHLRVPFFQRGETILVRLKLVRSSGGVGENEEGQDDFLAAQEIGEPNPAPILVRQFEIRSAVTDA